MIIGISGMISSGKSTLVKKLSDYYPNSIYIEEFSENDPVFNTFLRWCYEKQPNTDIAFQSFLVESLTDSFHKQKDKFAKTNDSQNSHMFLDRFILEHYIFAAATLNKKKKKYFEAFDKLFNHIYDPSCNPDFALFIDINWETFKSRIFQRGRKVEIDNFYENEEYFKYLHKIYKETFIDLAIKYNIPYEIIDSNNKSDTDVFNEAVSKIKKHIKETK
ncbi:Deoxyguanosine kinase [Mycoplasmopsis agalactiae 14628]|uniref:Deoxyguanosine kinase n=1 Tax=Mycoplasmopsis agalactiae 14628 TaxID=1110504 RepID=I5D588_MYCAA|nr:deoxynucleoside kinase [Mycoplasmopsis agalactiae]EIN14847.1 Deoxyguanosine kinase [Mycoplasmopsis agalactiae 14628]